ADRSTQPVVAGRTTDLSTLFVRSAQPVASILRSHGAGAQSRRESRSPLPAPLVPELHRVREQSLSGPIDREPPAALDLAVRPSPLAITRSAIDDPRERDVLSV